MTEEPASAPAVEEPATATEAEGPAVSPVAEPAAHEEDAHKKPKSPGVFDKCAPVPSAEAACSPTDPDPSQGQALLRREQEGEER